MFVSYDHMDASLVLPLIEVTVRHISNGNKCGQFSEHFKSEI